MEHNHILNDVTKDTLIDDLSLDDSEIEDIHLIIESRFELNPIKPYVYKRWKSINDIVKYVHLRLWENMRAKE